MISPVRARNCSTKTVGSGRVKGSKRICTPIDRVAYEQVIDNKVAFRQLLDENIKAYPEIFPSKIGEGYKLHGLLPQSEKIPEVRLRRIQLKAKDDEGKRQVFSVAPCFVLPYMTGYTAEVEKALFCTRSSACPSGV